jgi:hypothetical protein
MGGFDVHFAGRHFRWESCNHHRFAIVTHGLRRSCIHAGFAYPFNCTQFPLNTLWGPWYFPRYIFESRNWSRQCKLAKSMGTIWFGVMIGVGAAIGLLFVYYVWRELRALPETVRALKFHRAGFSWAEGPQGWLSRDPNNDDWIL